MAALAAQATADDGSVVLAVRHKGKEHRIGLVREEDALWTRAGLARHLEALTGVLSAEGPVGLTIKFSTRVF